MPKKKEQYSNTEYFLRSLLAGGAAGATGLVFVYPLDLARTRLSTDYKAADGIKKYNGLIDCLGQTYREGGIRALYRGFNISVAGIIPYRAVYFGGYSFLKRLFNVTNEKTTSFWLLFFLSETNTICAQFLTYPIDTVRRTLMKAGEKSKDGKPSRSFKNSLECFQWLIQTRGFTGLFAGALANTYRATGAALCMVFYDKLTAYLGHHE